MNLKNIALGLLIVAYSQSFAQKNGAGLYQSATDFEQNHLSIVADNEAIRFDDFFCRPYIWLKSSKKEYKIHKDSVFAFQTLDGKVYRLQNCNPFLLEDSGKLYIYSYNKKVSKIHRTIFTTRHRTKIVTQYFFSCGKIGKLQELTLNNVRLACLQNKQADEDLLKHFASDADLLKTNSDGKYLINSYFSN